MSHLTDGKILAKSAFKGAVAEKEGGGSPRAANRRFLADVNHRAGEFRRFAGAAGTALTGEPSRLAPPRAEPTPRQMFFYQLRRHDAVL
jgi:hypothetical protein